MPDETRQFLSLTLQKLRPICLPAGRLPKPRQPCQPAPIPKIVLR